MMRPLREQAVRDERVLLLDRVVLVASKSTPGLWHTVADYHCTCLGYAYRGRCRHVGVALEARTAERRQ